MKRVKQFGCEVKKGRLDLGMYFGNGGVGGCGG